MPTCCLLHQKCRCMEVSRYEYFLVGCCYIMTQSLYVSKEKTATDLDLPNILVSRLHESFLLSRMDISDEYQKRKKKKTTSHLSETWKGNMYR